MNRHDGCFQQICFAISLRLDHKTKEELGETTAGIQERDDYDLGKDSTKKWQCWGKAGDAGQREQISHFSKTVIE